MVTLQGDVFWVDLGEPSDSEPGHRRPCVVIQNDLFNRGRIKTTIICTLTSNLKRGRSPGNVTLFKDEANLPHKSVVNISQMYTVDKSKLHEKIGTLSKERIEEILAGVRLITEDKISEKSVFAPSVFTKLYISYLPLIPYPFHAPYEQVVKKI